MVEQLLKRIQSYKASDPDAIPAKLLKERSSSIAPIFADIFGRSLKTGDAPAVWREANISKVSKRGMPDGPANYRQISLTSIASKCLDHIVHTFIMDHLEYRGLLLNLQHGFRKERSCETQSSTIWPLQLDQAIKMYAIFLHFDTFSRKRPLNKLNCYGVRNEALV